MVTCYKQMEYMASFTSLYTLHLLWNAAHSVATYW